jgi:hypothetical protein
VAVSHWQRAPLGNDLSGGPGVHIGFERLI